ncbi:MAG: four helix bundle protein [Nanoarchaeota archaeon]|nr:four helix bundle protein [Nanoarchaeota archaeon]MBU1005223.1 four helix bundle protein [Nanoarchaeota archaeon]MBU1946894.1 four helix bundle protein [Nanoarchaeota archaeon]
MTQDFKKLEVWKLAHQFTLDIYRLTANFPKDERFGMTQQFRRASSSIGANIAEGAGRKTNKDFARALYFSSGSIKEIEHFLLLAKDLNYIDICKFNAFNQQLESIAKMLNKFIQCLHK